MFFNLLLSAVTTITGYASYYHPGLHGRLMANGKPYNQFAYTAATPGYSIPCGSQLRVTSFRTNRSTMVIVTDRMAPHNGRVIDLSSAAFKAFAVP